MNCRKFAMCTVSVGALFITSIKNAHIVHSSYPSLHFRTHHVHTALQLTFRLHKHSSVFLNRPIALHTLLHPNKSKLKNEIYIYIGRERRCEVCTSHTFHCYLVSFCSTLCICVCVTLLFPFCSFCSFAKFAQKCQ